jgi:hypothetical protein
MKKSEEDDEGTLEDARAKDKTDAKVGATSLGRYLLSPSAN